MVTQELVKVMNRDKFEKTLRRLTTSSIKGIEYNKFSDHVRVSKHVKNVDIARNPKLPRQDDNGNHLSINVQNYARFINGDTYLINIQRNMLERSRYNGSR